MKNGARRPNLIIHWKTADGYMAIIGNQYHEANEPQEFLNRANEQWPQLVFKLV